jgi:putative LysE/RhtB family amino acid efflux pump
MLFFTLAKAWIVGMAIAAPVGPIGMLCIRKTIELGFLGTIAVGLGAALADSIFGFIAALGVTAISHFLLEKVAVIKVIGGMFLFYLAYKEVRPEPISPKISRQHKGLSKLTVEIFLLTLTNPMTILCFIGIFSTIGSGSSIVELSIIVFGIFLGSMTWWVMLGSIIIKIKHKLPEIWVNRVRYISAIILGGFGIVAIASVIISS